MSRNPTTRFALLIGAAACCVLFLLASPGDLNTSLVQLTNVRKTK